MLSDREVVYFLWGKQTLSNENDPNPFAPGEQGGGPPPYQAQVGAGSKQEGDATGGIIPYKNPKALISYYLGILSGLPFIGIPLGITAFVMGIMGLRDRARNPVIKGSVHAAIGRGCGGCFLLFWAFVAVVAVIALVSR